MTEQAQEELVAIFRTLRIGEVILIEVDDAEKVREWTEFVKSISEDFMDRYPGLEDAVFLVHTSDTSIRSLDEEEMRAHGWIRLDQSFYDGLKKACEGREWTEGMRYDQILQEAFRRLDEAEDKLAVA